MFLSPWCQTYFMKVTLFANSDWYLYNFRRSFLLYLRDEGHDVLLITPPGEYAPRFAQMGLRWESLPMERRSLNPLYELRLLIHIFVVLRREKPDIVHGFTIKSAVYGGLVARIANIRGRVSAVAGLGYVFTSLDLKARLLRPVVRVLMRLAFGGRGGRLILQNPDDAELLRDAGVVAENHIRLIYGSGVDCQEFFPREHAPRAEGAPIRVLMAARLLWEKGVGEYINAARRLKIEGRKIEFLLAGTPDSGNPASVSEAELRAWIDEGVIQWLGHVDDMAELLRTIEIFVLPSYYGEGLPKSLIEAASSGLSIVTTNMPGCREVVVDNVDGLIVAIKDGDALAKAIADLDDAPLLRAKLGAAARAKALAMFDHNIVIKATIGVYRELIN